MAPRTSTHGEWWEVLWEQFKTDSLNFCFKTFFKECMAVHAVSSEPVSGAFSLFNREKTGKNCNSGSFWRCLGDSRPDSRRINSALQGVSLFSN